MHKKIITIILIALHVWAAENNETCPIIITRSQWDATGSGSINYLIVPIPYVVIHHTVTPECATTAECISRVQNIASFHMNDLEWDDIGFSFLIGGDGGIYEGCGWNREGAHTYGYNKKSIGVGFIGNFQGKTASNKMVEAAHKLIICGRSKGILRPNIRVIGARQVTSTISPGSELFEQIKNWPEWVSTP